MRAHGESKRPMYILTATGLVNVLLNLVFVIGFHLDAAGVALATVIAEYLSAIFALKILFYFGGEYHVELSEIRIHKEEFSKIVRIGVPAGFNGMMFSFSNVIVTSTVNAMGAASVAASSTANSVSSIVATVSSAFSTACVSFSGQNCGAGKFKRINRLLICSILVSESIFLTANVFLSIFPEFFLGLYTNEAEVISLAIPRLMVICWGYLIFLVSEMASGCSRGLGKTLSPTITNLFAICATRVGWVIFVFPHLPNTLFYLYLCYPISWFISSVIQLVIYFCAKKQKEREYQNKNLLAEIENETKCRR
jgi:putative MATE family efflux protein